jgi:threonine dehydrogenase-like Zn-dependent dehydrogenase
MEMSGGIGVDVVIDAVGMEAHGFTPENVLDVIKQKVGIGADRAAVLRQAIMACRKGGRVSVPGVYGGLSDKFPTGALMEKGLQLRTGQTHVHKHTRKLLAMIEDGTLDTTFLISHRLPLEDAAKGYHNFRTRQDEWTKVVLKPGMERQQETADAERQKEPV